ncbi:hypothetical protein ElyMa_003722700 [Elysia marginata]|uniref:Uncharacterized protein n=1 Tax=Elysia marginata TaxID=1093978 RepID=A0AAV4F409_9GAST|nr:hypothetical protein ElyMa_003722700 [Elysia marginata]
MKDLAIKKKENDAELHKQTHKKCAWTPQTEALNEERMLSTVVQRTTGKTFNGCGLQVFQTQAIGAFSSAAFILLLLNIGACPGVFSSKDAITRLFHSRLSTKGNG